MGINPPGMPLFRDSDQPAKPWPSHDGWLLPVYLWLCWDEGLQPADFWHSPGSAGDQSIPNSTHTSGLLYRAQSTGKHWILVYRFKTPLRTRTKKKAVKQVRPFPLPFKKNLHASGQRGGAGAKCHWSHRLPGYDTFVIYIPPTLKPGYPPVGPFRVMLH